MATQFEILEGMPVYGPYPEQFAATNWGTHSEGLGSAGQQWRTRRLSWDGIRVQSLEWPWLRGEAWTFGRQSVGPPLRSIFEPAMPRAEVMRAPNSERRRAFAQQGPAADGESGQRWLAQLKPDPLGGTGCSFAHGGHETSDR
jgi:hypothetical protein